MEKPYYKWANVKQVSNFILINHNTSNAFQVKKFNPKFKVS